MQPTISLAMDPPMLPPVNRTYPLDFRPMPFKNDPQNDDENMIIPRPISAHQEHDSTFEGMQVRDLQTILEHTSKRVLFTTKYIKEGPIVKGLSTRQVCLLGDHGTGKTVLAKAIVYKLISEDPSWYYEYKSSREFMGKYRNETGVRLRGYLHKVTHTGKPLLLIIDQLNKIVDHTRSEADDTSFASNLICNLLDDQQYNEHFFFIGLMDRATKLADRLKSRLLGHIITTKSPTTPQLKRIIFTSKCINESTHLHPEVTDEWLEYFLEQAPQITGRNFRGLALQVHGLLKKERGEEEEKRSVTLITRKHFEQALGDYLAAEKDKYHIDPYESYRDRLEREHQEKLQQREQEHVERMHALYGASVPDAESTSNNNEWCSIL